MERIIVLIADYKVEKKHCILETQSLGSCVGVALYDPFSQVSGLAHIMLPDSKNAPMEGKKGKYADTAIAEMLKQMLALGAVQGKIIAKIAGGACMFTGASISEFMHIGERNVHAVKQILATLKIPIIASDTGSSYGRTIEFRTNNGKLTIRSATKPDKEI